MRGAAGLVLAGSLSTTAFLLPPGISVDTKAFTNALAAPFAEGLHVPFTLPCPSCAFGATQQKIEGTTDGESTFWTQGGAHDLLLNLTISEDGQNLELGGTPIYPLSLRSSSLSPDKTLVAQIPAGVNMAELQPEQIIPLEVDSYGVSTDTDQEVTPFGDTIVPVRFDIMALNGQYMSFGGVKISLLRTSANTLMILDVQPLPPQPDYRFSHRPGHPEGQECEMLPAPLCRMKHMLEGQLQRLRHGPSRKHHRPCPGRLGGHHRGGPNAFVNEDGEPVHHHGRPHHSRPYHHRDHHHGHHRHSFFGAFSRGFLAVIVPIIAGVAVGMAVSLLGLLISRVVGFVWGFFSGASGSDYDRLPQEDVYTLYNDKIAAVESEARPVYEHTPPYKSVEKAER